MTTVQILLNVNQIQLISVSLTSVTTFLSKTMKPVSRLRMLMKVPSMESS